MSFINFLFIFCCYIASRFRFPFFFRFHSPRGGSYSGCQFLKVVNPQTDQHNQNNDWTINTIERLWVTSRMGACLHRSEMRLHQANLAPVGGFRVLGVLGVRYI
jgi:hypothetical protein